MNQAEKNDDEFDVERLRKQVSEIRTISTEETSAGNRPSQPTELNDFAKRVAVQFREDKFSPAMMTGFFRLVDFMALFAIGSAISVGYVQEDRVMAVYTLTIAAGAALSVLFMQFADCYHLPVLRSPRHGLGRPDPRGRLTGLVEKQAENLPLELPVAHRLGLEMVNVDGTARDRLPPATGLATALAKRHASLPSATDTATGKFLQDRAERKVNAAEEIWRLRLNVE